MAKIKLRKYNIKAAAFMQRLNTLADELYGEFGFSTLSEDDQHKVIAIAFKQEDDEKEKGK